jgi:anti-sigma B factor antagonist
MAAFASRRRAAERAAVLLQEQVAEPTARRTQRLVGDAAGQYRMEAGMYDYYDSEIELLGDTGVLTVAGETDLATSTQFRGDLAEMMEAASGDVVLDLTDLELVDSTALAIMMAAAGQMMAEQRSLVLVVARSHVLRVFAITGLLAFFSIVPSRTEAMVRLATSKVA